MTEHRIVEAMASSWDEHGHRPPRNWHIVCECGWSARGLPGQIEAYHAYDEHKAADPHPAPTED